MQFDKLTHDGQANAHSSMLPRAGGVGLPETVKNIRQEFLGNACTRIDNPELDMRIGLFQNDLNRSVFGCELDRIRQQIPNDLLNPVGIS